MTVARALVAAGPGIAMMGEQTIPRADTSVAIRPLPELPLLTEAAAAHMRPPAS